MTILEALKSKVNYPLANNNAEVNLVSRGINSTSDTFTTEIGQSKEFELAYADTLRFILTMVNLSQSGGSITQTSADELRGTANSIYRKYGEPIIGAKSDEQTSVTGLTIF